MLRTIGHGLAGLSLFCSCPAVADGVCDAAGAVTVASVADGASVSDAVACVVACAVASGVAASAADVPAAIGAADAAEVGTGVGVSTEAAGAVFVVEVEPLVEPDWSTEVNATGSGLISVPMKIAL